MSIAGVDAVRAFLYCATPLQWVAAASRPEYLGLLLIDHANCEKKAAATALQLMFRHIDRPDVLHRMSRLAREELRHFEQVLAIMQRRGIAYTHVSAGRYAKVLMQQVRSDEPQRLADTLIVGAVIEARSCERFAALASCLDAELAAFYRSLLAAEARHFQHYLQLAQATGAPDTAKRTEVLLTAEAELVNAPDNELRFHSGVPVSL